MGTLYVVSTPAGNFEGVSLEVLRVLKEVSLIAAYDTRHTRTLLNHFDISTPLTSCDQPNSPPRVEDLLDALRQGDVAVVMGAGTPDLSGPAGALVAAALDAGFPVSAVGATLAPPVREDAAGQQAARARAGRREAYNRLFRSRIVDDEY
jgi:16S rRNA (cytidine1402-2'-O)-methyltransferase